MSDFYVAPGKHYFYEIQERDGKWHRCTVTPLISGVVAEPAYYRVGKWKPFKDGMVNAFREDHRERETPYEWNNALIENRNWVSDDE